MKSILAFSFWFSCTTMLAITVLDYLKKNEVKPFSELIESTDPEHVFYQEIGGLRD